MYQGESEGLCDVHVFQGQGEGRVRDWVMYTVLRAGRGESEGLGDVHVLQGQGEGRVRDWVIMYMCIKGRESGE